MIYGIGIDLAKVSRFDKWVRDRSYLERFFNRAEILDGIDKDSSLRQISSACQHYAARFAAKEAFSKALGTGIRDFSLQEVFVINDELGKPVLCVTGKAKELLDRLCPDCKLYISLSHEKDYAAANVVIEK